MRSLAVNGGIGEGDSQLDHSRCHAGKGTLGAAAHKVMYTKNNRAIALPIKPLTHQSRHGLRQIEVRHE